VRGVDIKEPEYEPTAADEFELLDLTKWEDCLAATRGVDQVYGLAANTGWNRVYRKSQGRDRSG
jgi:hypothetical protein